MNPVRSRPASPRGRTPSALSRTSARRAEAQLWRKFDRIVARDLDPVDLPRSSDLEPEGFGGHKYVVVSHGATDHTQKKSLHAAEQDRPDIAEARRAFIRRQPALDPNHLVFIDETWAASQWHHREGAAAPRVCRLGSAAGCLYWE
jgi:hypothetical protein